jgi:lipopolysaccharide export system ATP-binding protein
MTGNPTTLPPQDIDALNKTQASPGPDAPVQQGIHAHGLYKHYGKRTVVRDVSLHVEPGEVVGLLGPNGAGKTTTFYMIVGLVAASAGKVFLGQQELTRKPMFRRARAGIGYLPQEPSVFRRLSVYDNLMSIVETLGIPRKQRRDYVLEHLEELHLSQVKDQKAYTLSGGERRRLEITRCLLSKPKFILLDEPFGGVDPISVQEVQQIIANLKLKGIGTLITDHNVRETLAITDRAYILHEGRVLCEGDAQHLIQDPQAQRHYLGKPFAS